MTFPNFLKCSLSRKAEIFTPVAGSFQNTPLYPAEEHQHQRWLYWQAAHFSFVLSWYKVFIAQSLYLFSGALQHSVNTSIIAVKMI